MSQVVLAIDDSPEIHELLAIRLASEGYEVLHALSAEEGLGVARQRLPDVILLDLLLPGMNGYQICRILKSDPVTALLPVIFLSGAADTFNKVQGLDLGAVDYVTKPFDVAELQARVRAALRTKRYQDLLAERAKVDGLTGLHNRAYFDARLADEVAASLRYGRMVGLFMIDVDYFKQINDSYGHPFGDRVLQAIGEVLQGAVRETDAACRYGGEEFAVIMCETALAGCVQASQRILERIHACTWKRNGEHIAITASGGLACSTQVESDQLTPQTLVNMADIALYEAKLQGRDRMVVSAEVSAVG